MQSEIERGREAEREGERGREAERQREGESGRERERDAEGEMQRERGRDAERESSLNGSSRTGETHDEKGAVPLGFLGGLGHSLFIKSHKEPFTAQTGEI